MYWIILISLYFQLTASSQNKEETEFGTFIGALRMISFEFSWNDFRWIQWIVPRSKNGIVTRDTSYSERDTFPDKVAKWIFYYYVSQWGQCPFYYYDKKM